MTLDEKLAELERRNEAARAGGGPERTEPPAWEYAAGMEVKRLNEAGCLWEGGRHWFVSEALAGEWVGLERLPLDTIAVAFSAKVSARERVEFGLLDEGPRTFEELDRLVVHSCHDFGRGSS